MEGDGTCKNLHEKLNKVSKEESKCTIYKVHRHLREVNPKAYEPEILAIGPYHRGKNDLKMMEDHKLRYFNLLVQHIDKNVENFVSTIGPLESRARKSYAEPIGLETTEFIEMLILDGCFIIEFVLKCCKPKLRQGNDPIFDLPWIGDSLQRDLMLFENQIPFFVLCKLYDLIEGPNQHDDLTELLLSFFKNMYPLARRVELGSREVFSYDIKHLLDMIHRNWRPNASEEERWQCATRVNGADMRIERIENSSEEETILGASSTSVGDVEANVGIERIENSSEEEEMMVTKSLTRVGDIEANLIFERKKCPTPTIYGSAAAWVLDCVRAATRVFERKWYPTPTIRGSAATRVGEPSSASVATRVRDPEDDPIFDSASSATRVGDLTPVFYECPTECASAATIVGEAICGSAATRVGDPTLAICGSAATRVGDPEDNLMFESASAATNVGETSSESAVTRVFKRETYPTQVISGSAATRVGDLGANLIFKSASAANRVFGRKNNPNPAISGSAATRVRDLEANLKFETSSAAATRFGEPNLASAATRVVEPSPASATTRVRDLEGNQIKKRNKNSSEKERMLFIKCATRLEEANVLFERTKKVMNLFELGFKNGTILMAPLTIEDVTESLFRNLIAYEQYFDNPADKSPNSFRYMSDYVHLLDCLIDSSKDIEILRQYGIIKSWLGDEEVVAKMINKLGDSISGPDDRFIYSEFFNNVNDHCEKRRNRWMAKLRRNYLNSPWAIISIIVGFVLLALTITQTVVGILQVV